MNRKVINWTLRFVVTGLILLGFLVGVVLNPFLVYANETELGKCVVYHNEPLEENLKFRLDNAIEILKASELYDPTIKFDICLNDGSFYPSLLEIFMGKAFALGFTSNKVAICGELNCKDNYVQVNGQKWNFTQLLAHEEAHCLVFHRVGFWKSNPVANNPNWKWEGYPEYIARRDSSQMDLVKNIEQLRDAIKTDKDAWGIRLPDSTISPREYFNYRLLNQYCIEIKRMSFENLLKDTTSEQTLQNEMMNWYFEQKNKSYRFN